MKARTAWELAAVAAGIGLWSYVAWDGALWDARFQALLHAGALAALLALAVLVGRGFELPRTPVDLPVLLLLSAFGVATLLAQNHGMSLRSLAAILATAAMLPLALVLLRHRSALVAMVTSVPILVLAFGTLVGLLARRLDWIAAGGPGLPPLRVPNEGTAFGSVAMPPFVLMGVLPLTFLIAEPQVRRWIQMAVLVAGVPLTILSGSRSAWLAIGGAVLVLVLPELRRVRLPRRWTAREMGLAAAAAVGGIAVVLLVAPRVTAVASLIYRGYLWRDTLDAWSSSPLTGLGPGVMPWARQAAAPTLSFPVRVPHSHDVLLGILGDAGMVGLAAALAVIVVFVAVAGPWRTRTRSGRAAFAVLAGFGVASFFEDLTFVPGFSLLVVLLAALALTDADAVTWHPVAVRRWLLIPAGVAAAALVLVTVIVDAAAVNYRFGSDAASEGHWPQAASWYASAVALDPWQPTGPKSLTVAAQMAGDLATARQAALDATRLNAGDGPSWTNLAILCLEEGDDGCASRAAARAVDTASLFGRELANAALVLDRLGQTDAADRAYRLSVLTNPSTTLALPWPRPIQLGRRLAPEIGETAGELNLVIGRGMLGKAIDVAQYEDPTARALAAAIVGDRAEAESSLAEALSTQREEVTAWDIAALLRRHWGEPIERTLAIDEALRGMPLATGRAGVPALTYDIASFRTYPLDGLVGPAVRLLPEDPWPWVLEPLLAPN